MNLIKFRFGLPSIYFFTQGNRKTAKRFAKLIVKYWKLTHKFRNWVHNLYNRAYSKVPLKIRKEIGFKPPYPPLLESVANLFEIILLEKEYYFSGETQDFIIKMLKQNISPDSEVSDDEMKMLKVKIIYFH